MLIRGTALMLLLVVLAACGGGGSSPAPAPTPPPPPTPQELWAVSGRVTAYGTNTGVAGARVTPDAGSAVDTDAGGNYRISSTSLPTSPAIKIKIEASGFLTREFRVRYQAGTRIDLNVDLIRLAPPFSLDFYRQLVRNAYDDTSGSYELVWRLHQSPRFYVRTIDQNGRAVEPEVISRLQPAIRRAVGDWSNGVLSVAALETGTETRPRTDGWIMVNITRDYQSPFCGRAYVGSTRGEIELVNDRCACGSNKIADSVVAHEVGHALGFFHVGDERALMFPYYPGRCPPGDLTAGERYHSAVAYGRTRGNADPDSDHESAVMLRPVFEAPDILIEN